MSDSINSLDGMQYGLTNQLEETQYGLTDWLDQYEMERLKLKEEIAYLRGIIETMKNREFIHSKEIIRYRALVGHEYDLKYSKP